MLTGSDGWRLRRAGFTHREIDAFAGATTPSGEDQAPINLDGPTWQKVMKRRRRVAQKIKNQYEEETGKEMSRERLDRHIDAQGVDPWEWVKLEYKHGRKRISDFSAAMKKARTDALIRTRMVRKGYR